MFRNTWESTLSVLRGEVQAELKRIEAKAQLGDAVPGIEQSREAVIALRDLAAVLDQANQDYLRLLRLWAWS